jgi:hypothetical protein
MLYPVIPALQTLALWLLAQEVTGGAPAGKTNATFRVCEKLCESLTTLMGAAGYRSLISRALTLAKHDAPSLELVQVKEGGSLEWTGASEHQGMDDAGGAVLVARLLGLLVTFIGPALTLRLVRDLWPDSPFEDKNSATEKEL